MSKLYTAQQLADLVGWNVGSIQRHAHDGDIPHTRDGRAYVFSERGLEVARLLATKPRKPSTQAQRPTQPTIHGLTPRYQTMEESGLGWLRAEWDARQEAILAATEGR